MGKYSYCKYVDLVVVVGIGVHGCIICHMYTPHFTRAAMNETVALSVRALLVALALAHLVPPLTASM